MVALRRQREQESAVMSGRKGTPGCRNSLCKDPEARDGFPAQAAASNFSCWRLRALSLSFFKSHVYLKPDFKMLSSALKPDFFFLLQILKPHLGSHSSQRRSSAADLGGSVGQPVSGTEPPSPLSSTVAFGQLADVFLSGQSHVVSTQPEHGHLSTPGRPGFSNV